jgi:N-acetylmuramoyl-L-alanine amidase
MLAAAALCGGVSPAALSRAIVEDVELLAEERQTTLVVDLSEDSTYRLFTLSAPDRVVLDLVTARLGAHALPLPAGSGAVRQVRAANRPDGSVRLVLDLSARAEPEGVMRRAAGATGTRLVLALHTRPAPAAAAPPALATAAMQPGAKPGGSVAAVAAVGPASGAAPAPAPVAATPATELSGVPMGSTPVPPPVQVPAPATSSSAREVESQPIGRDIVVAIDAGHGGKDPGAHGPRGVREKDVTLRLARRLADIVNAEPGMRAVLTRNRDEFIPLRGRMERARAAQADLFISIHADAVRNRKVRGASVYVLNEKGATDEAARRLAARENAADLIGGVSLRSRDPTLASVLLDLSQNASLSSSIEVADDILEEMARVGTVRKRQVMQAPFMVLKSPDVPSVLVETAYISNPDEERRLDSHDYRGRLATAIFTGVRDYFYRNPPRGSLVAELGRQRLARTVEHVIRRGETLSTIASRYHTSVGRIRDANRLKSDRVAAGQVIRIPLNT